MHVTHLPRRGGDLAGIRFFSITSKGSSEEMSVFKLLSWEPKGGGDLAGGGGLAVATQSKASAS